MQDKIVIGTAQFGLNYGISNKSGIVKKNDVKLILDKAIKNKIFSLDTASAYGNCHKILGNFGVNNMEVYTKISKIPNDCQDIKLSIFHEFEKILSDLNTNSVKALYFHDPMQLLSKDGDEIYKSVLELKDIGKIEKIGFSIYSPSQLDSLSQYYQPDLVQLPYNIFDTRFENTGWLKKLKKNNIEVHARSIFLQGLLFYNLKNLPLRFFKYKQLWNEYENWLKKINRSPYESALSFVLSNSNITKVIIGMDNVTQLNELLNFKLSRIEKPKFNSLIDENLLVPSNWTKL